MKAAAVVLILFVAGCSVPAAPGEESCAPPVDRLDLELHAWKFRAGEPTDLLRASWGPQPSVEAPAVTPKEMRWNHSVLAQTEGSVLHAFRVWPEAGEGDVFTEWAVVRGTEGCPGRTPLALGHLSEVHEDGERADVGKGVHLFYAGFWENGTLFGSNLPEDAFGPDWPRAGWYDADSKELLPVYVYDQDRAERPPYWANPFTGTPAAGSPGDDAAGVGYYTTIKGFNEALKGLSTHTSRVVHVAADDAYTRPGNENHPLYGDALVFFIEAFEVVDAPCPQATMFACMVDP